MKVSFKDEKRNIFLHVALSLAFLAAFLLLNRPEVILISRIGSVVWYPATGFAFALLLGVSPHYAILISFAGALAGVLIYEQPPTTYSETIGAIGISLFYAIAARDLRGKFRIDLGLRRRRDIVLYLSLTTLAAVVSALVGVTCLALDHATPWNEFGSAFLMWFLGDEIGLLGVAPFLLIHVLPWIRQQLSPSLIGSQPLRARPRRRKSLIWASLEAVAQAATICNIVVGGVRPGAR